MLIKRALYTFLLFGLLIQANGQSDTIVSRYREYLLNTAAYTVEDARTWRAGLNGETGQWADIDYRDERPADWQVSWQLERIREMALAWAAPASALHHDPALLEAIARATDHWLKKRYQSANWWHNEIGVPQLMRDIVVLMRGSLSPEQTKQMLEVMGQLRVHDDYVGGNLIWCADLGLHYGALTGDRKLVTRCRDLIVNEIRISTGEGVQPDFSFHQHGKRLQMYQYGKAFLQESLRIAWQLRETSLAFPQDKIGILTGFMLEGWQWMARGIHTVPGTMDRSASRKGELRSADLRHLIPLVCELQPRKTPEFRKMASIQNGEGTLTGFRYFPYSDFAAYHRPGFSFFLKNISARTLATESINQENLKGRLLNSGDAYLIRNGEEYFNLMPAWDWQALPGVTAFPEAHRIDRRPFTGGVGNGRSGLIAMDYRMENEGGEKRFSAHKIWACHEDVVVCLISDLRAENITDTVYTALDQCRRQGEVTINKPGYRFKGGRCLFQSVKWIHHAGFAYIPLKPSPVRLTLESRKASWKAINAAEVADTVAEQVFMPLLLHSPGSSGYLLA
ncbi:MAG: polysaccharide lyase family 8 super-sandwich domain-containing protein, partial [Mangrovibacterium sp.]|nr:polysaccharide lyase family 8 super-sandwich domain-containing protein [Mangrovibacterium sp.]